MQIPCKSCGLLLNIPDDIKETCIKEITVSCPACQKDIVCSVEAIAKASKKYSANSTSSDSEQTPTEEPFPEYATRESYHHPRIWKLQRFSCMDAMLTTYRTIKQHLGVTLLMLLLLPLPLLAKTKVQSILEPEKNEVVADSSEKLLLEDASKDNKANDKSNEEDIMSYVRMAIYFFLNLISVFLYIGCIRLFNAYGRNQKASLKLIFSGYDSPIRAAITCLFLLFLFDFCHEAAGIMHIMTNWKSSIFFCTIFSTTYVLSLFFMFQLIADTNLSAFNSIRLSFYIAHRNFLSMLGIILTTILVMGIYGYIMIAFVGVFFPIVLTYESEIFIPVFEVYYVGISSACYLKATGQFRE